MHTVSKLEAEGLQQQKTTLGSTSAKNRKLRLQWPQAHQNWKNVAWSKDNRDPKQVVFTDKLIED